MSMNGSPPTDPPADRPHPQIQQFLDECCRRESGARVPVKWLYQAYVTYIGEAAAKSARAFGMALTALGFGTERKSKMRYRTGLALVDDDLSSVTPAEPAKSENRDNPGDDLPPVPDVWMKENGQPTAPGFLSLPMQDWWNDTADQLRESPGFGDVALRSLTIAAQLWDRGQQARRAIEEEGILLFNHLNNRVSHPAVDIERRSLKDYRDMCERLGVDAIEVLD